MTWPRPIRRLLLSITRRAEPALDRVLKTSGDTVEKLAEKVDYYRTMAGEARQEAVDAYAGYAAELEEAIALSRDPWSGAPKSYRESKYSPPATRELMTIREALPARLKETIYGMAELEIALDDRGWKRMIAYSTYEFSRYGIQSLILICRLYFIKNPLVRRGVCVSAHYVWGRGMEPSSPDKDANKLLQAFYSDPRNQSVLSHSAFVQHEQALWTDGNLFFVFFSDPDTGETIVRNFDSIEMADIISDPDDASVPWYFRRQWIEQKLTANGLRGTVSRDEWYATVGWDEIDNFQKFDAIEGQPVAKDKAGNYIPVLHLKVGYLPKWRFGAPLAYPALDWARAYREGLENLCTTWKALSRYATQITTKGGAPAIAAIKQTMQTTFMNDLSTLETNPPPATGAAFISGPDTKINPIKSAGVTVPASEFQRVLLMVCAAFGLGEHMFGDISSGNWATSNALDRPTELMFKERQEWWIDALQRIGCYVLRQSVVKPSGKLREALAKRQGVSTEAFDPKTVLLETRPVHREIDGAMTKIWEAAKSKKLATPQAITQSYDFPAIVEGDQPARINAIVAALTLGGYPAIGIDEKVGIEMLLSELGYEDPHELVEEMYPEQSGDEGYQRDRTIEPEPPEPPPPPAAVPGAAPPAPGSEPPVAPPVPGAPAATEPPAAPSKPTAKKSPLTAKEAALLRAVAGLHRVLKLQEAKNGHS